MAIDLILEPFERAIASLQEAVHAQRVKTGDRFIRDACIQRFEYTYELSHKMLRRYLVMTSASPVALSELSFQMLIRAGSEHGLLMSDWATWAAYRAARAATSHGYDERKAIEVFGIIPMFLEEAIYLRDRLKERISRGAS